MTYNNIMISADNGVTELSIPLEINDGGVIYIRGHVSNRRLVEICPWMNKIPKDAHKSNKGGHETDVVHAWPGWGDGLMGPWSKFRMRTVAGGIKGLWGDGQAASLTAVVRYSFRQIRRTD